jgi:anti-anti-sigma factor
MKIDPAEVPSQFAAVWKFTDGRRSLCVSGELDLATAPLLDKALEGEIESGTDVTFDVEGLRFMDAAGLGVLVRARRSIGRRGRVRLRDPGPIVQRLLFLTGLDGADGFCQSTNAVSA